jgi:hypothetical protein
LHDYTTAAAGGATSIEQPHIGSPTGHLSELLSDKSPERFAMDHELER